jgi:uncharacterized protein (DUF305 family)
MIAPGTRSARALLVAMFAGVAGAACASSPRASVQVVPSPVTTPSDPAFVAKARADSMLRPYTRADIHFMSGMIGHHAQAIVMARWAPTHGASPAVRTLAARITNAQSDEIALMQHWLRDRNQDVPDATPMGMKMEMEGMEHMMLMPGMLNDAQMKELNAARGAEYDRLFLTYMIQHHNGAVTMVRELFATDGAGQDEQVFKFASDVQVDQSTEIARMERMLDQMTGQKRTP